MIPLTNPDLGDPRVVVLEHDIGEQTLDIGNSEVVSGSAGTAFKCRRYEGGTLVSDSLKVTDAREPDRDIFPNLPPMDSHGCCQEPVNQGQFAGCCRAQEGSGALFQDTYQDRRLQATRGRRAYDRRILRPSAAPRTIRNTRGEPRLEVHGG